MPSPRRIAIAIETYNPAHGGAERSTAQIAAELVRRGHDVTLLCHRGKNPVAGEKILEFPGSKSRSLVNLTRARDWIVAQLEQGGYDIDLSMTSLIPARIVQPRAGLTKVLIERRKCWRGRSRRFVGANLRQRKLLTLENQCMASDRVQRFVAISDYMHEQLREAYGIAADRIALIRNAAEMPSLDQAERDKRRMAIREALAIAPSAPVFLFPANDPDRKGVAPLMQAFARVTHQCSIARLITVGAGTAPLRKLATRHGIEGFVRLVRRTDDMASFYAASDVMVLPTYYDPASKVVIESMLMGVPAITTRFNGSADLIRAGSPEEHRGGVLDDPDDVDALAKAMLDWIRQPRTCSLDPEPLTMTRHVDELEKLIDQLSRA